MYWQGESDAQCSPIRDAASSLLASGEGWKRELIGSSTPTSTLDASHSRLAGISDDNRKTSVMTETLLYVFVSVERHSELSEKL